MNHNSEQKLSDDLVFDFKEKPEHGFYEYVFRGRFSEDITSYVLKLTEAKFMKRKDTRGVRKRISFIIIENIQNIIRHQDIPTDEKLAENCFFILHKTEKVIRVITGNYLKTSRRPKLEKYLKNVQGLSKVGLKELYKERLQYGEISKKGGAGLGLISMGRRTDGNFHYNFEKIDSDYCFYTLQTELFLTIDNDIEAEEVFFDKVLEFHKHLINKNIMLNFRGAFAFDNVESLFPLINSDTVGGFGKKRLIYNISVNLIRNIVLYADRELENNRIISENTAGIFSLSKKDGKILITSGNYIYNSKALTLRNKIDLINKTETDGLLKIRDYLDNFYPEERVGRPDVSLIDMKLTNNNQFINYKFETIDKLRSFFIIQIFV